MPRRPVLLLCLNRATWGEAHIARSLVRDLSSLGRPCRILAHASSASVFPRARLFADAEGPRLLHLIGDLVRRERPAALVLADAFTATGTLSLFGLDPAGLRNFEVPLAALDPWDVEESGVTMDVFDGRRYELPRWVREIPIRLRPVPLLRPEGPGRCRWLALRKPAILKDARSVLFCTSRWQQGPFGRPAGARLAAALPRRIVEALRRAGPDLRLIHVGPQPLEAGAALGRRYVWQPPCPPSAFARLLRSAGLLLTANLPSTVVGEALLSGIPVLALEGRRARPHYPFAVWPLGLAAFTAPLWKDNPLLEAVRRVDWMDGPALVDSLRTLLCDSSERRALRQGQMSYARRVAALPTSGRLLEDGL